jgi:hypothetical protein
VHRKIDDSFDMEAALAAQVLEDVAAPLTPPVLRHHRVEHGRAVGVKANPVVRKDGVRRHGRGGIRHHDRLDSRGRQGLDQTVELKAGGRLLRRGIHAPGIPLERVRRGGLGIGMEGAWPDEQNRVGSLLFGGMHLAIVARPGTRVTIPRRRRPAAVP